MTKQQIKIDKYISELMRETSKQVIELMESDIPALTKEVLAASYGARWDALNTVRNFVFYLEDDDAKSSYNDIYR